MALQIDFDTGNGVKATYAKVVKEQKDRQKHTLTATVGCFLDKATSDANDRPLTSFTFQGDFTKEQLEGDTTPLSYTMVKDQANAPEKPYGLNLNRIGCRALKGATDV